MVAQKDDKAALCERWKYLYRDYLPALAKARDPVQSHWPVHLDHCFARICLDSAVGIERPWTHVVKAPAIHNMSYEQLSATVTLAEDIATGRVNLADLNELSLNLRSQNHKAILDSNENVKKRKSEGESAQDKQPASKAKKPDGPTISSYFLPSPTGTPKKTASDQAADEDGSSETKYEHAGGVDMDVELKRIDDSDLSAFRKHTLALLCRIPRGRYSTYQAMSDHISKTTHKTCARAVGNAMRNNPFAPNVPCHRILAADGTLGGFKGSWGEEGKFADQKHRLLHDEGVRFDSRGKVKGPPFRDFERLL